MRNTFGFFLRGKKESRKSSLKDEVKRIQLTRILWNGTSQRGALLGQMQVRNRIGLIHLAYKRKNSLMEFHVWVHSENMLWSPLTSTYISGATLCDYKSICQVVNQTFSLCQWESLWDLKMECTAIFSSWKVRFKLYHSFQIIRSHKHFGYETLCFLSKKLGGMMVDFFFKVHFIQLERKVLEYVNCLQLCSKNPLGTLCIDILYCLWVM